MRKLIVLFVCMAIIPISFAYRSSFHSYSRGYGAHMRMPSYHSRSYNRSYRMPSYHSHNYSGYKGYHSYHAPKLPKQNYSIPHVTSGTHRVKTYTKRDGTIVQGHLSGNPKSGIHCHDNVCK